MLRDESFRRVPELSKALEMLSEEKFAKMVAFVHSPAGQKVRTNNHVERVNRELRYLEKVRYKWRRRRTIVRFVVLALDRWRQARLRDEQGAAASTAGPTPASSARPEDRAAA